MGRALQQWMDSHDLPTIAAAVLGAITALALLLVVGGYYMVQP